MATVTENLWQQMLLCVEYFTCNELNLTFPHSGVSFLITLYLCFYICVCLYMKNKVDMQFLSMLVSVIVFLF